MHSVMRMSDAVKIEDSLGVVLRGHFMLASIFTGRCSRWGCGSMSDEVYDKGLSLGDDRPVVRRPRLDARRVAATG